MHTIMIVTDMDGTLLTMDQKISEENRAAIKRFQDAGGMFTLATGRMEASVRPFIENLRLNTPMILYNGAKIYCPTTQTALYEQGMQLPRHVWQCYLDLLQEDVGMLLYQQGKVYTPRANTIVTEHEKKDSVICGAIEHASLNEAITKLLIISDNPERLKQFERATVASGLPLDFVYSEANYLEILPRGVSKGAALEKLVGLYPFPIYTIAVGDNLNDVTMIQTADKGVAVANAHPELKKIADEITVHHEQHAIAKIIDDLLEQIEKTERSS
ncbi:Cof-type HAD-IIB family hydrolase [Brevibacillus nitrificans]|uniref:Cof-type HAD-IIB family hydrolase n=1 Tax=Brevibacillus nitrificans TaxID=651560 RepID=UPI00262D9532|nr:Cof-type HAD-IIB family hydrolase [Brevibacillus nitrificans]MED1794696.1 Cof-type HAD-IIB family hydrolase [Brevibacillus nitrificans]